MCLFPILEPNWCWQNCPSLKPWLSAQKHCQQKHRSNNSIYYHPARNTVWLEVIIRWQTAKHNLDEMCAANAEMIMPAANPKNIIDFSVISCEKHCEWTANASPHLPTFFASWYISAAPCKSLTPSCRYLHRFHSCNTAAFWLHFGSG